MNKNYIFLQQIILIVIMLLLTWIIGYWYNNYEYFPFWFFGLMFMLIIGPIIGLSYIRLYKKLPLGRLNFAFRTSAWFGIVILAIPNFIYIILDNVYWIHRPELSYISNLWFNMKWLINLTVLIDISSATIKFWPYWIAVGLIYWSISTNKKLSTNP